MKVIYDDSSPAIRFLSEKDARLAWLFRQIGPLTRELHDDPFEFLAEIVVQQMLSIAVADRITGRIRALCGGELSPVSLGKATDEALRGAGLSGRKVSTLRAFADAVLSGALDLAELRKLPDDGVSARLRTIKGIGPWSVKMFLIFVLGREDILPLEDITFVRAYRWLSGETADKLMPDMFDPWRPYRSVAAMYLYEALDSGLCSTPKP